MTSKKVVISVLALILAFMVPVTSFAATVQVEAEDFTDSHDIGFELIRAMTMSGCTNGAGMTGMDVVGEWVEYPLVVNAFGDYTFTIHYRGGPSQYSMLLHLTGGTSGLVQTLDMSFPGYGYG